MTDLAGTKQKFREQLLDADSASLTLRLDYERRMNAMLERKLTRAKKFWFVTLTLFCIIAGATTLMLALTEPKLPPVARIGLLIGTMFAVSWSVFLVRIVRRGTMKLRIDPPLAAGMGFMFALIMCVLFAVAGMPPAYVTMNAALFLIPAGLIVLRTVIEQSESRMQERLVELQYKVARLTEKFGDDDDLLGSGVR